MVKVLKDAKSGVLKESRKDTKYPKRGKLKGLGKLPKYSEGGSGVLNELRVLVLKALSTNI